MREYLGPLVVALLCIAALGLAATTLTSVSNPNSGGQDGEESDVLPSEGPQFGDGENGTDSDPSDPVIETGQEQCGDFTETIPVIFIVSLGVSVIAYLFVGKVKTVPRVFIASFVPLTLLVLLFFAAVDCGDPTVLDLPQATDPTPPAEEPAEIGPANSSGQAEGGETDSNFIVDLLGPLALLAVVVVVLFGLYARRLRADGRLFESEPDDGDVTESIGSVAGEAADRLESDADIDNEVYRAWAEMAGILDVDRPETSTPAEFAHAAREAGIDAGDVDELTALFEEVRYGTAEATPLREQRAIDALRRIERNYADDDGATWSGAG